MNKSVTLVAASILISGCTTMKTQPIDAKATESIKGQTIAYTTRAKPDFSAMTAGKGAFALLGALAAISEGNQLVATHQVQDPAVAISEGLLKAFESKHAAKLVSTPIKVAGDDIGKIASSAGDAQYVIDVETINWMFVYFPTDWTHYRVIHSAKARLIDVKSKSVIAEGACSRSPEATSTSPTYDQLMGRDAAGLKAELATAASECIQTLKSQAFGL